MMRADRDVESPAAEIEAPVSGAVDPRARRRRAAVLVAASTALAACGAYALRWIGETSLLFVVIGFVVYARAKLGWFG